MTLMRAGILCLWAIAVSTVVWDVKNSSCSRRSDNYVISSNGITMFSIDKSNGSCYCASFIGDGSRLSNLPLGDVNDRLDHLASTIGALGGAVDVVSAENRVQDASLSALNTSLGACCDEQSRRIASLDSSLLADRVSIAEQTRQITMLNGTATADHASIADQARQIAILNSTLAAKSTFADDQAQQIASLNSSLAAKDALISQQATQITALESSLASLTGTLKTDGSACFASYQCTSGFCAGGVCRRFKFLRFPGNSTVGYVVTNALAKNFPNGSFTTSVWFKNKFNGTGAGYNNPFSVCYSMASQDNMYELSNHNIIVWNKGVATNPHAAIDDLWHFHTVVWQHNTKLMQYYIDAQLYTSATCSWVTSGPFQSGGHVVVGQEPDSPGGSFDPNQAFGGQITKLGIWDGTRTQTQVSLDMQADTYTVEPSLRLAWGLQQTSGTAVTDYSGHGNPGPLYGPGQAVWWASL
eukprot:TRINITY_DN15077_c0_g1_i1.p1 TRINITY_DN15077_c0_g1~~TRINITY_DN15077_c0_g1_i1.p1  ORF type:complete len:470 (+),score=79.87 TRINITY_DN15077_c0_g1_i1:79-1488(+)